MPANTHVGKAPSLPFASEQGASINPDERTPRRRGKAKADPQCVSVWPYLTLKVYPNGKAGGEKPVNTSEEHTRDEALRLREVLKRDLAITEQWLKAWDAGQREEFEMRP